MKQTKNILFSLSILATSLLAGCDSVLGFDAPNGNKGDTMEVAFTRSGEDSSTASGFLIFWKNNFSDFFTTEVNDLNVYGSIKYNTGEPYPIDGTAVKVTGFSPANMKQDDNYKTLTLPNGTEPGMLDVCTASEIIEGTYSNPFSQTMTFGHTLTKVTFAVQRDVSMEHSKDVRDVVITIPANYLPTQWRWNGKKYEADQSVHAGDSLDLKYGLINGLDCHVVATTYLMLPTENGGILNNLRVQAETIPTGSTIGAKKINQKTDAQLYEADNTPVNNAKPGDAYEILIKFQQNSFTLEASQSDWEKGGLIYIPVKPQSMIRETFKTAHL